MFPTTLRRVALLLTALLLLAACKSSESNSEPTPATTPADAAAIRDVDLSRQPAVATVVSQFAGEVDTRSILYADLTADGREEAAVPIASGGTLGNLAYIVFTMRSGSPAPVLTRTVDKTSRSGLRMEAVDGRGREARDALHVILNAALARA